MSEEGVGRVYQACQAVEGLDADLETTLDSLRNGFPIWKPLLKLNPGPGTNGHAHVHHADSAPCAYREQTLINLYIMGHCAYISCHDLQVRRGMHVYLVSSMR